MALPEGIPATRFPCAGTAAAGSGHSRQLTPVKSFAWVGAFGHSP